MSTKRQHIQHIDSKEIINTNYLVENKTSDTSSDESQYYDSVNDDINETNQSKSKRRTLEEILVVNSKYDDRQYLVHRLLANLLIENKCYMCGIGPEWQGKHLTLQLDHINGVNTDNTIENLRLLCPNCHTQTDTFGAKNIFKRNCVLCDKKIAGKYDKCDECYQKEGTRNIVQGKGKKCDCGKPIYKRSTKCKECSMIDRKNGKYVNKSCSKNKRIFNPTKEELEDMISNQKLSYSIIGNKYGVGKAIVGMRCKEYGIFSKNNKIKKST